MPLTLLPATLSDIPTLSLLHLHAFMLVRINQALYPRGLTPAIISATESRHRNTFLNDRTAHYLKIVDSDIPPHGHENIIAFAEYHLFPTAAAESTRQDLKPKTWPDDVDLELATEFWAHIVDARKQMEGIPHVFLSVIATRPGCGRKGAAGELMRWGVERADEIEREDGEENGVECFLEASPMGVGLYRKWGFVRVGGFEVEVKKGKGEGEGEGEVYRHEVMRRPVKGKRKGEIVQKQ